MSKVGEYYRELRELGITPKSTRKNPVEKKDAEKDVKKINKNQQLFIDGLDVKPAWENEYTGMPEYNNINEPNAKITATFKFRNEVDYEEFKEKVKQDFGGV